MKDLQTIKARWKDTPPLTPYVTDRGGVVLINSPFPLNMAEAAKEAITHAPQDVADLIAEVERQQAMIVEMRKAMFATWEAWVGGKPYESMACRIADLANAAESTGESLAKRIEALEQIAQSAYNYLAATEDDKPSQTEIFYRYNLIDRLKELEDTQ